MTSKIINMADRLKDDTDLKLESMFRSAPVHDDGFSAKVMRRVRRQMWVQRLSLPIACTIGLIFAAKPIVQLLQILPGIFGRALTELDVTPAAGLIEGPTILLGAMLLAGLLMLGRILED